MNGFLFIKSKKWSNAIYAVIFIHTFIYTIIYSGNYSNSLVTKFNTTEDYPEQKAWNKFWHNFSLFKVSPLKFTALPSTDLFLINESKIHKRYCHGGSDKASIYILALIISSWTNFHARQRVRETWAFSGSISEANRTHYIRHVFLVGQAPSYNSTLSKQEILISQNKLESEIESFQDIVGANFIDNYANLTYKTMTGIAFALMEGHRNKNSPLFESSCFKKYLLKIDDDTLPNLKYLMKTLVNYHKNPMINKNSVSRQPSVSFPVFICKVAHNWLPIRSPEHKNFLSPSDYPPEKLMPFCPGAAYLVSYDLKTLENMCNTSRFTKYIANEDVYVTGMLSELLNISLIDMGEYYSNMDSYTLKEKSEKYMFSTHIKDDYSYKNIWKNIESR
ncbi:unnamed protein product [Gordionus sp. m RMFG-2023]|uniref:beta-1,3-galactosyltransferase 5-like n=1 Tax=Gordionus sp. m RMFG-2023 TaxID=3053472 RepID=UPI0030E2A1F1